MREARQGTKRTDSLLLLGLVSQTRSTSNSSKLGLLDERLLNPVDVLQSKLVLDDLHVSDRVDVTLDVDDLGVVERSDDLEDTVDSPDVRQERVSETGSGGGTFRTKQQSKRQSE